MYDVIALIFVVVLIYLGYRGYGNVWGPKKDGKDVWR